MEAYFVNSTIENGIATLTFHHPKSNSFPSQQLNSLIGQFKDLGENDKVKVIVLKSEGDRVFSAGASFDELMSLKSYDEAKKFFSGFGNLIMAMRNCPKFIIGNILGKAVGGGIGIISACDYAIAHESSGIKLSELSIGFGPFVIEPAVTRRIGLNAFSELSLHPKNWKSAEWAKDKGLYHSIYSTEEELNNKVQEFAIELTSYSAEAMEEIKNMLWENTENWKSLMTKRAEISGRLVLKESAQKLLNNLKK